MKHYRIQKVKVKVKVRKSKTKSTNAPKNMNRNMNNINSSRRKVDNNNNNKLDSDNINSNNSNRTPSKTMRRIPRRSERKNLNNSNKSTKEKNKKQSESERNVYSILRSKSRKNIATPKQKQKQKSELISEQSSEDSDLDINIDNTSNNTNGRSSNSKDNGNGKKDLKFIDAMGLRKTLFHWQRTRTKQIFDLPKYNVKKLSLDDSLLYGQVCLSCLTECHHSNWIAHSQSKEHQSTWYKNPRIVELRRSIPLADTNEMEQENNKTLPTLMSKDYFLQIANYRSGSKVLVLGEQDFGYSLAVSRILEKNGLVIGTSYLAAFDENSQYIEPEEQQDDGIHASHSSLLKNNLNTLNRNGVITAHNIDATRLYENLRDQQLIENGPFDIVVFPFPNVSSKGGLDFQNSLLVQGLLHNLRKYRNKLLYCHSQIQFLVLENQFKDCDILNIAKENGWTLKWRCLADFDLLSGYQASVTNDNNDGAWFVVFQFDENYPRSRKELELLDKLNYQNQDALKFEKFGMGFPINGINNMSNVGMINGTGNVNSMNAMSNGNTSANDATMNSMATATCNENKNTNVAAASATQPLALSGNLKVEMVFQIMFVSHDRQPNCLVFVTILVLMLETNFD